MVYVTENRGEWDDGRKKKKSTAESRRTNLRQRGSDTKLNHGFVIV